MEFQSGVLLCSVVEKVEYMRGIQGVCRKANLTKANALHNISKALEILQQKKVVCSQFHSPTCQSLGHLD